MTAALVAVVAVLAVALVVLLVWGRRLVGWWRGLSAGDLPRPDDRVDAEGDPVLRALHRIEDRLAVVESINRRLRRVVIVLVGFVAVLVAVAVVTGSLVLANRERDRLQEAQALERRAADCRSYDDIANAIKQGNLGAIRTILDPQFVGNMNPAELQPFVDAFAANGAAGVDAAIVAARARKGYSADCSKIGKPPGG